MRLSSTGRSLITVSSETNLAERGIFGGSFGETGSAFGEDDDCLGGENDGLGDAGGDFGRGFSGVTAGDFGDLGVDFVDISGGVSGLICFSGRPFEALLPTSCSSNRLETAIIVSFS